MTTYERMAFERSFVAIDSFEFKILMKMKFMAIHLNHNYTLCIFSKSCRVTTNKYFFGNEPLAFIVAMVLKSSRPLGRLCIAK